MHSTKSEIEGVKINCLSNNTMAWELKYFSYIKCDDDLVGRYDSWLEIKQRPTNTSVNIGL